MTEPVRIFVDERPAAATPGSSVLDAVAGDDPDLAAALRQGSAYVTDGVGRPIEPTTTVFPGAIYRIVRSARRPAR
jgi:hypothetical protein